MVGNCDDRGRTHLSFKLVCAQCGQLLRMSNGDIKGSRHSEGEPTGYKNRQCHIVVYPCDCTLVSERKLETLKEILK